MSSIREKKGFTVIESLVAIAILITGIMAPIAVIHNSIILSNRSIDNVTAFFLAQEGIEYIRGVRDTNILEGDDWLDDMQHCISTDGSGGNACNLRHPTSFVNSPGDFSNCGSGPCNPIEWDGFYYKGSPGPGVATKFTRTIVIAETVADQEALLTVTVEWDAVEGIGQSVVLREQIFNWTGF